MEELFKAMEKKLDNLKRLGEIMDEMKGITQTIKADIDKDESFKNLINVNEIDEWSFSLIKNLQEIDKTQAVKIGKAELKLHELDFLNWENLRKGLKERGLVVIKDDHVKNFFNNALVIAMKYFISKQEAREKAKALVKKSKGKVKSKNKKK